MSVGVTVSFGDSLPQLKRAIAQNDTSVSFFIVDMVCTYHLLISIALNKESVEMSAIQTDGCGKTKILIATILHTLRY